MFHRLLGLATAPRVDFSVMSPPSLVLLLVVDVLQGSGSVLLLGPGGGRSWDLQEFDRGVTPDG